MSDSTTSGDDMRPVVRTAGKDNRGLYAFLVILLVGGVWVFSALSAARQEAQTPAVIARGDDGSRIASPAPLQIPFDTAYAPDPAGARPSAVRLVAEPRAIPVPPAPQYGQDFYPPPPVQSPPAPEVPRNLAPAQPAFDPFSQQDFVDTDEDPLTSDSISAERLAHPAYTVAQGTMIPAVLETAFDSTRPGRVRALVQRDVYSFDGTRVLVPRGSRLFGEYNAGINPGERRAMIEWTRLMRPDGVSIALDSPASDPLGRGGVEGDVHSRFLARFGGALLQTVLNIGTGFALSEAVGGGTVIAMPGSTQNITGSEQSSARPVLEIDHGTSVSVYVARDLDFYSVDR